MTCEQQLAEIGSTRQDVVVRIIWIGAEVIAGTQSSPRFRHDLHQAHGPLGRQRSHIAEALDLHDGAYPRRRNAEPLRRFGDDGGDWIGRRGDAVLLGGDRFGVSNADDDQQYRRDADPKEGARAAPAPWHPCIASGRRWDREGEGTEPRWLRRSGSPEAGLRHGQCSWSVQSGSARPTTAVVGSGPKYRPSRESPDCQFMRKTSPPATTRQPCQTGSGRLS
jgi:hypothetical protein